MKLGEFCWSDYEGCVCDGENGHEGLHKCPDENCGREWTDKDERDWHIRLRWEME